MNPSAKVVQGRRLMHVDLGMSMFVKVQNSSLDIIMLIGSLLCE